MNTKNKEDFFKAIIGLIIFLCYVVCFFGIVELNNIINKYNPSAYAINTAPKVTSSSPIDNSQLRNNLLVLSKLHPTYYILSKVYNPKMELFGGQEDYIDRFNSMHEATDQANLYVSVTSGGFIVKNDKGNIQFDDWGNIIEENEVICRIWKNGEVLKTIGSYIIKTDKE